MFYKLNLFQSVLPIILVGIFYHAPAMADDNGDNVKTMVNAVAQAVSQATAPTDDQTASSDDNTTDDADDSDADDSNDSDGDGAAADTQTPDEATAAADAVAKGIEAFKEGDYPTAVKWFSIGAYKYHDARSQNDLAKFEANGLGTPQNYPEAMKLFHRAAAHSTGKIKADAESSVGIMYAKGMGVPQNPKKATHWIKRSAKHGNREAKDNLAILHRPGSSFKVNAEKIHTGSLKMAGAQHGKR